MIAPPDHSSDGGEFSPVSFLSTGRYVPDVSGRGPVGGMYEVQLLINRLDLAPAGALPAVALYTST